MYNRIFIPVYGSPTFEHSLEEVVKLAKLTGACMRLVPIPLLLRACAAAAAQA